MEELIKLLQEQNELLRSLLGGEKSGWSNSSPFSAQWVFVGRNGADCCYSLGDNGVQVPIKERFLSGKLISVRRSLETRRDRETEKLTISIETSSGVINVQTGMLSQFAKSVITLLVSVNPGEFVTIGFYPGEDEKVVFGNVYVAGRKLEKIGCESEQDYRNAIAFVEQKFGEPSKKSVQLPTSKTTKNDDISQKQLKPVPSHPYGDLIAKIRKISGHTKEWVVWNLREMGLKSPAQCNEFQLRKLIEAMAVSFGFNSGVFQSSEGVLSAYRAKVDFFEAAGKTWQDGAITWFEEVAANGSRKIS